MSEPVVVPSEPDLALLRAWLDELVRSMEATDYAGARTRYAQDHFFQYGAIHPELLRGLDEAQAHQWEDGSSAREVVWRNVAIVNPLVSGWRRPPLARMRVVDPNRSRCVSAAVTATSCASSRRWSPVSAHHTDSDFGAENVASNPDTARTTRPSIVYRSTNSRPNGVPDVGSRPDINDSSASTSTRPDRPSPVA